MLVKTMRLRLDELAMYVAFILGSFVFGSILLALITYFESGSPDYTVFRLGTAMACMVFGFLSVMMGMFGTSSYFNWHVGLSRTRKSFFVCDVVTEFCWNLIGFTIIWGLSLIEGGILKVFYSPYSEGKEIPWGLWIAWLIPVLALFLIVIREFTGSILMRFGNKAFWVMWAFWMVICIVPGKIAENKTGVMAEMIRKVTAWISGVSVTGWAFMGIAFAIMLLAGSWLIIRKQAVKG